MAEGIANKFFPKNINIHSAGTEAHGMNSMAMKVMEDISISIAHHKSKKINFEKINQFNLVITLCGDAKDKCPQFSSNVEHIHWDIEDPANFNGSNEDIYKKYTEVRDIILDKIKIFNQRLKNI